MVVVSKMNSFTGHPWGGSQLLSSPLCGDVMTYTEGTSVYLQATAADGSEFVEWQINGEAVTGSVEITGDMTISVVFDEAAPEEPMPEEPTPEEPQP